MLEHTRDNHWLAERLDGLRSTYFADVPIGNVILVRFGRASRSRLGSIIARPHKGYAQPVTFITINSLLRDVSVPEFVIEATLMHEFVHYTHGFHSPLEKQFTHPHRGNIVDKEIKARGGGQILKQQQEWLKAEYPEFILKHLGPTKRRRKKYLFSYH